MMEPNAIHLWTQTIINIIVFVVTGVGAIVTVVYKLSQHEKKLSDNVKELLQIQDRYHEKKTTRVYERLDEYKGLVEGQFVRKDMCGVLHLKTAEEVNKIGLRIDLMDQKLDDMKIMIFNQWKKPYEPKP